MSGFPVKRKKYSWLPESDPSAVSGDTGNSAASSTKNESIEKALRQPRSRVKAAGKGKSKDKASDSTCATPKTDPASDPAMVVDVLGISTPAPRSSSKASPTLGGNEEKTAELEKANGEAGNDTKPNSTNPTQSSQSVSSKIRRRSRKDSVDELVRSRFISNMNSQHENGAPLSKPVSASGGVTSNGSSSRPRKRAGEPAIASITASVRDALANERTAHSRLSPALMSISQPSHNSPATSVPTVTTAAINNSNTGGEAVKGSRHRSSNNRHSHLHIGNGISGASTPGKQYTPMTSAPTVRLGSLESKYSFPTYPSLNPRNVASSLRRGDHGVGPVSQTRGLEVTTGENVIVIHPGSRWLRIGRASDAVPRELPHVIARRLKVKPLLAKNEKNAAASTEPSSVAQVPEASGMDVDGEGSEKPSNKSAKEIGVENGSSEMDVDKRESDQEDSDSSNDEDVDDMSGRPDQEASAVGSTLEMLRDALKQHQRQSKRKVPPNVYSQVLTYNRQTRPETIHDHNDPFRVEWVPSSEVGGDYIVGEKVLHIADPDDFVIRYPIRNGYINVEDYASIEEVLGDIETIWTSAINTELGISKRNLKKFGAVLVIPDLYNRVEVIALSEMLLRRMGFQYMLIQQSSALVTFGAGFSTACVVDVGAQKTSIACVEDGFCYQESRVSVMYGGDDITRFLYNLFMRSSFPYHEASLQSMYDWHMLNDLRERYCTMNLSDVNIRLHDFFVRRPHQTTRKFSFKTYDEAYQAPLCLFYPAIVDAYYQAPDYLQTFANGSYPEMFGEVKPVGCSSGLTPTQFGILPSRALEAGVEPATLQTNTTEASVDDSNGNIAAEAATAPATVPGTEPGTPNMGDQSAGVSVSSAAKPISTAVKEILQSEGASQTSPSTPSVPSVSYIPDSSAQNIRMPLDTAITHSIVHAGSMDRAKKLYSSIVIVGGGVSFIPGFDDLLSSRLMYMRPEYLQSIERAEIVSAPRDLDPRVLAWKGGAVLSRLECAKEMWIASQEWTDFGPKLLRDRILFPW
ncbi:actin-like protein arp8 [Coemansia spiralis]|uniref:Actin-like protein arp8 n=2 Tax=Coemansia TaxID=4863 RepID=A0A9W8KVM5_9FUNG|nr:hypothetical protein BX070DRAFT_218287 [Coemansia spiralis]KAJ1988815.1 actin-like protein arp8 [Coemansia umbellata]KAJ2618790.1 actin-like protein arp8 [Coemansia sp. RSA 1358]KAJ2668972.1 actin-like protein arp8 [Coemansia spiralis]